MASAPLNEKKHQQGDAPKNRMTVVFAVLTLGATFLAYNANSSSLQPASSSSSSTSSTTRRADCVDILNKLDASFDLRQATRQKNTHLITKGMQQMPIGITMYDIFEPEAICLSDERFGGIDRYDAFGDGPKFVCGVDYMISKFKNSTDCLVYNIGSNYEILFETAVKKYMPTCEIHTFDPTLQPNKPYNGLEYSDFHPFGFGKDGETMTHPRSGKDVTIDLMSVETVVKKLGHEGKTIDIFKIDCEGCEFTAIVDALNAVAAGRLSFHQMQIEIHLASNFVANNMIFEAADRAGMRIFHKERNHWGCDGWRCVEYAFVSKQFLREANAFSFCPGVEDLSNI